MHHTLCILHHEYKIIISYERNYVLVVGVFLTLREAYILSLEPIEKALGECCTGYVFGCRGYVVLEFYFSGQLKHKPS